MVKLKVIIRQSKKFLRRIACASTAAVLLSASLTGCSASASSINKDSGSSGEALASDKSPALDNDSPLTMEGRDSTLRRLRRWGTLRVLEMQILNA